LFALAAFDGPHLLILDEPTNHLDVDSREALIHALNDYEGAAILISHDRHLLEACADRLWIVRDGTVRVFDGDLDAYRALCLTERGEARKLRTGRSQADIDPRQEIRRQAASRRAEAAPLKKRVRQHEALIERITQQIAKLDARLADGALYASNPAGIEDIARVRGELVKTLAQAEDAWLRASEAYDAAREC
jgi:ATP-binding cassette subfamily F protein 3